MLKALTTNLLKAYLQLSLYICVCVSKLVCYKITNIGKVMQVVLD